MLVFKSTAKAVSAGAYHTMVLDRNGALWATGRNNDGEFGDGSGKGTSKFIQVINSDVQAVTAGLTHSLVLKRDGSVWATGSNEFGQLGDGKVLDSKAKILKFVKILSNSGAKALAACAQHSLMVKQDGSLWNTGSNKYGQLGDHLKPGRTSFKQVISSGVLAVGTGPAAHHSVILMQDNSVRATGKNTAGQLGGGLQGDKSQFVQVSSLGQGKMVRRGAPWNLY